MTDFRQSEQARNVGMNPEIITLFISGINMFPDDPFL